jgi:8-oxo-dGTP diphosphatase
MEIVTYTYPYEKADHTVDAVVFGLDGVELKILLIRRGRASEPFYDCWALPGGFISIEETLEESLRRELKEETGLELSYVEQLKTFGAPGRDPRGRVITTAFMALVPPTVVEGADDAAEAKWFSISELPELAFDHSKIVALGVDSIRKLMYKREVLSGLLPEEFTLGDLNIIFNAVLGTDQDKRNFRRKVTNIITGTEKSRGGSNRPARLYQLRK